MEQKYLEAVTLCWFYVGGEYKKNSYYKFHKKKKKERVIKRGKKRCEKIGKERTYKFENGELLFVSFFFLSTHGTEPP